MARYSSFLIRCWTQRDNPAAKYIGEHSQTGEEFRTGDLHQLLRWLESQCDRELPADEAQPGQPGEGQGEETGEDNEG